MPLPRRIARRCRALSRREELDSEMTEEMRAHLELCRRWPAFEPARIPVQGVVGAARHRRPDMG